jgi:hypothetical protein
MITISAGEDGTTSEALNFVPLEAGLVNVTASIPGFIATPDGLSTIEVTGELQPVPALQPGSFLLLIAGLIASASWAMKRLSARPRG